jgi:hypothetical protein
MNDARSMPLPCNLRRALFAALATGRREYLSLFVFERRKVRDSRKKLHFKYSQGEEKFMSINKNPIRLFMFSRLSRRARKKKVAA